MQVKNVPSYLECLSDARIQSYRHFFTGATIPTDDELVSLYQWNNEISEMTWKLISLIEIAFRNKIHQVLSDELFINPKKTVANGSKTNQFLTNTVSTLNLGTKKSCNWYNAVNFTGEPLNKIVAITHKKNKNNHKFYLRNPNFNPDDVISRLTFGFWRFIFLNLSNAGEDHKKIISKTFRYSPFYNGIISPRVEFKLDARLDMIHSIRNRISHHEPLWKLGDMLEEAKSPTQHKKFNRKIIKSKPKNLTESCEHLKYYHSQMVEFLTWIDKDLADSYRNSWWSERLIFLCSKRDVKGITNMIPLNTDIPYQKLKRDIKSIVFRDRARIICKGNKKSLIIPLK